MLSFQMLVIVLGIDKPNWVKLKRSCRPKAHSYYYLWVLRIFYPSPFSWLQWNATLDWDNSPVPSPILPWSQYLMRLAHPFGADTFIYILNKLVTFSLYCHLVLDSVCLPSFFSLISKHCICILHSKESRCYKTDPYFSQMMAKITNNRLWRLNKKIPV